MMILAKILGIFLILVIPAQDAMSSVNSLTVQGVSSAMMKDSLIGNLSMASAYASAQSSTWILGM